MEKIKKPTSPKVAWLGFYDDLKKKLKRHHPRDYIIWMSRRLADSWSDPEKFVQIPPHRIIHSIEANCAYWKEGYSDSVTWNAVAKIMNIYNGFTDPVLLGTISENLDRFFLMMYREQIELQKGISWAHIMRGWHLFVRDTSMQKSNLEFFSKFGITMDQWVKLCFICWLIAVKMAGNPFLIKNVPDTNTGIGQKEFDAFLKYSARYPCDIGKYYSEVRTVVPYERHSLIRSSFFETPIVMFDDKTMIVPHTHLLFRHSGEGLYRLAKDLSVFGDEFSDSFERYVRKVLESLQGFKHILSEKQLKKAVSNKCCDFLVELKDALVLVECKACSFTANHFSDNAIINSNSTGKVAEGFVQLYATAKDVGDDKFVTLKVDKAKPTIGMVVTFGEIPSANSDWYFEEFFLKRASKKFVQETYPSKQMERRPIILDISTLEMLVAFLNFHSKSLVKLYDERKSQGYHITGDWGIWLGSQYKKEENKHELLRFLEEDRLEFLKGISISPDLLPE